MQAKNISILKTFFEWAVLSQGLYGDPARPIKPPKKKGLPDDLRRADGSADPRVRP
jgi:site-specific recombinase XerD